jgi:hypothetical protein
MDIFYVHLPFTVVDDSDSHLRVEAHGDINSRTAYSTARDTRLPPISRRSVKKTATSS